MIFWLTICSSCTYGGMFTLSGLRFFTISSYYDNVIKLSIHFFASKSSMSVAAMTPRPPLLPPVVDHRLALKIANRQTLSDHSSLLVKIPFLKSPELSGAREFHPRGRVEGATQLVPQPPQNVTCGFPALRSSELDSQHSERFHPHVRKRKLRPL